ncbi:TRAP transporter small permease [Alteribacillus sp. YIM 98480]|uniref:TRAP transporter small permease n=1 Tax=Alteribacillus sp. YIM 98480 TaxID=2606599 RepID=UPI00131DD1DA|nr:TRAP transporter small permease [Alteribacillus sp. YIM 98480]
MKKLQYILKLICSVLLIILVVLLACNVFLRYVVGQPLDWTEEAGMLILVWITFLGAVLAAGENKHMGMDLVYNKFKGTSKKVMTTLMGGLIIIGLFMVVYYGAEMTINNLNLKSESLQISYAYFYLAIPVSCLLYGIIEVQKLVNLYRNNQKEGNL